MTDYGIKQTLIGMKLWQKCIIFPLVLLAVAYWFALMGLFMVLCWPAIKFIQLFDLKGLPKPKPLTMFPGKYVN